MEERKWYDAPYLEDGVEVGRCLDESQHSALLTDWTEGTPQIEIKCPKWDTGGCTTKNGKVIGCWLKHENMDNYEVMDKSPLVIEVGLMMNEAKFAPNGFHLEFTDVISSTNPEYADIS